jgi:glyoxylase-like metal-dependent hydrolase (beta-lactamase superfamily II)
MRISPRVHLLASGRLGCSLSHPSDCNVYAVACGSAYLIVDTGVGVQTPRILEELAADGIDPARIEAILLTHAHLDHSGGARFLRDNLRVPVCASPGAAAALEAGDEEAISLSAARRAGIYSDDVRWDPCPVERILSGGDSFRAGDCVVTSLETPGHSADMLSFLIDSPDGGLLFSGDTIFSGGKILLQATWDCDLQATWDCDLQACCRSLRKLGELRFSGLYPGHGLWSVSEGMRHVETSLSWLNRLLIPPDFLSSHL